MEFKKSLVAIACIAMTIFLAACGSKTTTTKNSTTNTETAPSDKSSKNSTETKEEPLPPKPMFVGWEKPAVAIVLSGEQNGYLEPCGCSETQSGGMARRADLFEQLKKKEWPLAAFDAGGLLRRARRQSELKFGAILDSLSDLNYSATGLGPSELNIGPYKLLEYGTMEAEEGSSPPIQFVSANITLLDDPELGVPLRTKVIEVNGVKIGVTSIIGQSIQNQMLQSDSGELQVLPVKETLPTAIEELKTAEADVNILLSFAEVEESLELGKEYSFFDVVLTAKSAEDPDPRAVPIDDSGRILVKVGQKGKHVGVLGFYPEAEKKFRWELVNLDNRRFENHASMAVHMKSYQENLMFEELAKTEPALTHPSGKTFVGAKTCNMCHPKAYKVWKNSKHSHAYTTLLKGHPKKGAPEDWIPRVSDPECLSCHVVGWDAQENIRYDSGFISDAESAHLKGQQCENCHGPASKHVDMEGRWIQDRKSVDEKLVLAERRAMHLDVKTAEKEVCSKCHDHENSPHFDFEKYWKEIVHPFRD